MRAVALVSGEWSDEKKGMTQTAATLDRAGIPARLFVMPKTGHLYSDKMEDVMKDALAFLVAHESP